MPTTNVATMRTVRFHEHGEPLDVLRLDEAAVPTPAADHIRVRVVACGLTPADSALCRGLFAADLPRGVGLELSGTVDAVGANVTDVEVGELVFGVPAFAGYHSAGLSDFAVLANWAPIPEGLDAMQAAALPMAVETAYRALDRLGVDTGHTVLVNGAGTTVGFAAVQMALARGATVIATSGENFMGRLRDLGIAVTSYGDGVVDRVGAIVDGRVDLVLATAPASGALPDLIKIAGNDHQHVLTFSDFAGAD